MDKNLPEECKEKIIEIENDVKQYVRRHKKMPDAFMVSKNEFEILREARKHGAYPKIRYNGQIKPITISYGGFRYGI